MLDMQQVRCMKVPYPTIAQALANDGAKLEVATGVNADGSDAPDAEKVQEVTEQAEVAIMCALALAACLVPVVMEYGSTGLNLSRSILFPSLTKDGMHIL